MTIQDCWLAVEKRHVQDAIRSLMRKMNIDVVELAENHEKTRFCGMNLVAPATPATPSWPPNAMWRRAATCSSPFPGGAGSLLPVVLCPVYHGSSGLLLQILPGRLAEGREKGPAHSGTVVP
ncbi:MAG: hypothetical protein ACLR1T_14110 [Evtepia gabavorous]